MKRTLLGVSMFMLIAIPGLSIATEGLSEVHHKEIRKHLEHVTQQVDSLSGKTSQQQRQIMQQIVAFYGDHVQLHLVWEREVLYPAVDKYVVAIYSYTDPMRYEHKILREWFGDLEAISSGSNPEVKKFISKAYNMLGLFSAHLDVEEAIFFPIVNKHLSPEELQKIMSEKLPKDS